MEFNCSMGFGEMKPSWALMEVYQQMTYRDRALKQYQTIVQKLWQIFAKHDLINSQVNVLLALSQDR